MIKGVLRVDLDWKHPWDLVTNADSGPSQELSQDG